MSRADQIFKQNCRDILQNGVWDTDQQVRPHWDDGTPAHTVKKFGIVNRYGPWRDTHLRFQGDAVDQMQMRFIMDWNFTAKFGLIHLGEKYFPKKEQQIKGVRTQIVSSGPDTQWKNIRNGYFKMINEAESNVFLTTPYFVPDDGIFEALRVAALSGLDVRIIIPGNPDHFFVYWASMSYLGELLEAGVRVYQYEKGFIHAKVLTIDGTVSSVGSANMDIRSFDLNFEVNAFMYDAGITKILEDDFLKDLHSSVEITKEWYRRRKWWFKVREAIARLISPSAFMPVLGGNTSMNIPGTSYWSPISGGNSILDSGSAAFGVTGLGNYPGFPSGAAPIAWGFGMDTSYDTSGTITGGASSLYSASSIGGSVGLNAAAYGAGVATGFGVPGTSWVLPTAGVVSGFAGVVQAMAPYMGSFGLGATVLGNLLQGTSSAGLAAYQNISGSILSNADTILSNKVRNIETVVKMLDTQGDIVKKMLKDSIEGDSKQVQNM